MLKVFLKSRFDKKVHVYGSESGVIHVFISLICTVMSVKMLHVRWHLSVNKS